MTSNLPVTIDGSIKSDDVVQYLTNPGSIQIEAIQQDPEEVAARIRAQLLGSESAAALFGEQSVTKAKDIIGKPFKLVNVEWQTSDIEGAGLPFYGVFTIEDAKGATDIMTCGATNVVMKAAIAASRGWLPVWVKIVEREKTEAGYTPLDLVAAPEPSAPVKGSKGQPDF